MVNRFKILSPATFWDQAGPLLNESPAVHQVIIKAAYDALEAAEPPLLVAFCAEGGAVHGAVAFGKTDASVGGSVTVTNARALLSELEGAALERVAGIAEVEGPLESAEAFAEAYAEIFGCGVKPGMDLQSFALGSLQPGKAAGRLRSVTADDADLPLLARWFEESKQDAFGEDPKPMSEEAAARNLKRASRDAASGNLFIWDGEGQPKAFCMASELHHGSSIYSINIVYTDRAHRGHGYAGSIVSGICAQKQLTFKNIVLFADVSSSYGAGAVYERVGFQRAGVHAVRCFVRASAQ